MSLSLCGRSSSVGSPHTQNQRNPAGTDNEGENKCSQVKLHLQSDAYNAQWHQWDRSFDLLKAVCVPERSREKNSCKIQVLWIYKTDVFYPMSERGLSETGLIHYLRCHLVNLTTHFQSVQDQISSVNETINLINHSNFLLPQLCFPSSNTILHVEVARLIKTGLLLRKHPYKWLQTKPRYILYKSYNKYASTTVCTLLLLEMCWVNFVFFIADCSLRCCLTEQHYTKRCFFNTLTDI